MSDIRKEYKVDGDPDRKPSILFITKNKYFFIGIILVIIAIAVDQISKNFIVNNLEYGQSIQVIDNILSITYVRNPGAAFSFLSDSTIVFTILSSLVTIILFIVICKSKNRFWTVCLSGLLAGSLGNLLDRIFRYPGVFKGHVVDFIDTPWIVPAIYNFADMMIVFSVIIFVLLSFFGVPFKKDTTFKEAFLNRKDNKRTKLNEQ